MGVTELPAQVANRSVTEARAVFDVTRHSEEGLPLYFVIIRFLIELINQTRLPGGLEPVKPSEALVSVSSWTSRLARSRAAPAEPSALEGAGGSREESEVRLGHCHLLVSQHWVPGACKKHAQVAGQTSWKQTGGLCPVPRKSQAWANTWSCCCEGWCLSPSPLPPLSPTMEQVLPGALSQSGLVIPDACPSLALYIGLNACTSALKDWNDMTAHTLPCRKSQDTNNPPVTRGRNQCPVLVMLTAVTRGRRQPSGV
uniref:uncharacterized protein LOC129514116 n=1 Tax=Nyctereutes procyonoides TaxID=34880 RepID=UPI002443E2E1|nr:uncharacterized protein LOC129514116 [Nyctereutes procyonoides]